MTEIYLSDRGNGAIGNIAGYFIVDDEVNVIEFLSNFWKMIIRY